MKEKILFLTTNNLATNPRLVKELTTAENMSLSATVVQYKLGNWSDNKSEQLKEVVRDVKAVVRGEKIVVSNEKIVVSDDLSGANAKKREVEFIEIDATSRRKFSWLKWGILEKLAQRIHPMFKNNLFINALASSRRSLQLVNELKKSEKPDLIVAHNLGALYPAYVLSKKWQIPFIFDVEDYHPGEFIRHDAKNEKARREFLMKTLLPKATAITSASPLIGQYTLNLIGGHPNHSVILNSFPQSEFIPPHHQLTTHYSPLITPNPLLPTPPSSLNLVWFSQKISFGRGLEHLFEALKILHSANHFPRNCREADDSADSLLNIQYSKLKHHNSQLKTHNLKLTLIGDLDPAFETQIIQPFKSQIANHKSQITIQIKPPMIQQELHFELAYHDVGLALEPGKDLNNNLAISNKIIAYAQAGLYILATNTPAQNEFMAQDPSRGMVCGQTTEEMANALIEMINLKEMIQASGKERFEKGKSLAWEKEREKLQAIWEL